MSRKSDVRRIAEHLGVKPADFQTMYLKADEDGDLILKMLPCPFLGTDDRCTIYDVRPLIVPSIRFESLTIEQHRQDVPFSVKSREIDFTVRKITDSINNISP